MLDKNTYSRLSGVCDCELPIVCAKLDRPPPFARACPGGTGAPLIGPPKAHCELLPTQPYYQLCISRQANFQNILTQLPIL
jgi:hypothetical protein